MSAGPVWLVDAPWDIGRVVREHPSGRLALGDAGNGTPVLVRAATEPPLLSGTYGKAPRMGFPIQPGQGALDAFHLPTPHSHGFARPADPLGLIDLFGDPIWIEQPGLLERKAAAADPVLTPLVLWMTHVMQELAFDDSDEDAEPFAGLVRRDWPAVVEEVLRPNLTEPRMELIVRLAQDLPLHKVLAQVSRSPRVILRRERDQLPVGRIQELDAACIRDFARRPGRSVAEKAGPRQRLLAVRRQTTSDTLENRVARWVDVELADYGTEWLALNGHFGGSHSRRFRDVKRLRGRAQLWAASEPMQDVLHGSFSHPAQANYPLMMEPRYKRVFAVYRQLLRRRQVEDDAWTWRRRLWADICRLLVSSAMLSRDRGTTRREGAPASSVYFRGGPDRGAWICQTPLPGPFGVGKDRLHLIDAQELTDGLRASWRTASPSKPLASVGGLGPEFVILNETSARSVLVWPFHHVGSIERAESLARSAATALDEHLGREGLPEGSLSGLLMLAHDMPGRGIEFSEHRVGKGRVVQVALPASVASFDAKRYADVVRDLLDAIEIVVDYSAAR